MVGSEVGRLKDEFELGEMYEGRGRSNSKGG